MRSVACQITSPNSAVASNVPSLFITSRHGSPRIVSGMPLAASTSLVNPNSVPSGVPASPRLRSTVSMLSVKACVSLACFASSE